MMVDSSPSLTHTGCWAHCILRNGLSDEESLDITWLPPAPPKVAVKVVSVVAICVSVNFFLFVLLRIGWSPWIHRADVFYGFWIILSHGLFTGFFCFMLSLLPQCQAPIFLALVGRSLCDITTQRCQSSRVNAWAPWGFQLYSPETSDVKLNLTERAILSDHKWIAGKETILPTLKWHLLSPMWLDLIWL